MNTVFVTQAEFDDLRDYSCSLPTGTTIGKRWKRSNVYVRPKEPLKWWLGEYYEVDEPGQVGIRWSELEVRSTYVLNVIFTSPVRPLQ